MESLNENESTECNLIKNAINICTQEMSILSLNNAKYRCICSSLTSNKSSISEIILIEVIFKSMLSYYNINSSEK